MLENIKRKLFLMIGRGIVKAINNETKIMKVQITGLKGETITDIEYPQNYGFASMPDKADDLEAVMAFIGGNRDQGITLIIHDRDNRPTLENGDVIVYAKDKCKTVYKIDKSVKTSNDSGYYELKANGDLELNGNADFAVAFNDLKTGFDQLKSDVSNFITTTYNLHTHVETGATTAVPIPTGSASTASIDSAKVTTVKLP